MTHEEWFEEARRVASHALCDRDKCGAVIVQNDVIIGSGYNAPPQDDLHNKKCHLDLVLSDKPKSDRTCCVHAEWRAILDAVKKSKDLHGSTLYFTRVKTDGSIAPANGVPYCTVCSRLALETGISFFALYTKEGVVIYNTKEFNELSYLFHQKANYLSEKTNE